MRRLRLGRTQQLAVAALKSLGGRGRLAGVVAEAAGILGLDGYVIPRKVLKNRILAALQRLVARGLVGTDGSGFYWLKPPLGYSDIYVENFRVRLGNGREVQLWSKRDAGHALELEEALALADLRGAAELVQVELGVVEGQLDQVMDRYGISQIVYYKGDPAWPYLGSTKMEIRLGKNAPLKPTLLELDGWVRLVGGVRREVRRAAQA